MKLFILILILFIAKAQNEKNPPNSNNNNLPKKEKSLEIKKIEFGTCLEAITPEEKLKHCEVIFPKKEYERRKCKVIFNK